MPERQYSHSDKILMQGDFKNSNFPIVQSIGKNLDVQSSKIFKNLNFQSLPGTATSKNPNFSISL